jgi:hypothetical protein
MSAANEAGRTEAPVIRDAVVVDLGEKKAKLVKQLRRGKGKLFADVKRCIDELAASGVVSGAIQPVVVVVSEQAAGRCLFCRLMS